MSPRQSAILRAEILRGDATEVTCALEMTSESVFVVTEALPSVEDVVFTWLSFPRCVRPVLVGLRVQQVRFSAGPGSPSGFLGTFEVDTDEEREQLAELASALAPRESVVLRGRALSVLIVENNDLIRDMFAYALGKYFKSRHVRVDLVQAATGEEALRLIEPDAAARRFDLVLVDHFLTNESGASVVKNLRAHPSHVSTLIVAMSVGGNSVRDTMIEAGADLFLHKPIVLRDLFCTLEFLIDPPGGSLGAA